MSQQGSNGSCEAYSGLTRSNVDCETVMGLRGIIDSDSLPIERTITDAVCCQELSGVAQQLEGKQDRVCFLHNNASSHVAKLSREK